MGQDASPRRGQTVRFTYGQTDCAEWGNVTAPSRCLRSLARSLPVNVSTAERSHGPQSDRLHTYYICGAGNSPAAPLSLLKQPERWRQRMEAREKKKRGQRAEKKKNQSPQQMQVSRKGVMKWLFKHSAVISISAVQKASNHAVGLNTSRYWVQQGEKSTIYVLFKVQRVVASEAGLETRWTYVGTLFSPFCWVYK